MSTVCNEQVLHRIKYKEMHLLNNTIKKKMAFAGCILRGSSGRDALQILEGKLESKSAKEGQDECGWTTLKVGQIWTHMKL